MDKKIILFDIDGTLINTKSMAKIFCEKIATESNINLEKIIQLRDEYITTLEYSTDYHPNELVNFINKKTNKKLNPEEIFFKEKDIYKKYIFDDAFNVLDKLKDNYKLGIFSEGFDDYQGRKISPLIDLLDKDQIFISRRKLDNSFLEKLPKGAIIIDDRKEVVEKLRDFGGFKVFWLDRKNEQEKIDGITKIKDLIELEKLI